MAARYAPRAGWSVEEGRFKQERKRGVVDVVVRTLKLGTICNARRGLVSRSGDVVVVEWTRRGRECASSEKIYAESNRKPAPATKHKRVAVAYSVRKSRSSLPCGPFHLAPIYKRESWRQTT